MTFHGPIASNGLTEMSYIYLSISLEYRYLLENQRIRHDVFLGKILEINTK